MITFQKFSRTSDDFYYKVFNKEGEEFAYIETTEDNNVVFSTEDPTIFTIEELFEILMIMIQSEKDMR